MSPPEQHAPVEARYANYFQVGFNDVEFILDFGQELEGEPVIHSRMVLSPPNAEPFLELVLKSVAAFKRQQGNTRAIDD